MRLGIALIKVTLILMIITTALSPLTYVVSARREYTVLEVVLNRNIVDEDINIISKLGGRIIYRFDDIKGLVIHIGKESVSRLVKSLNDIKSINEAGIVRPLSEVLPSTCLKHSSNFTWNLDMINVPTVHEEGYSGSGVYVAVLDTGLEPHWKDYFAEESIYVEGAAAFLGAMATSYPVTGKVLNRNAWEADSDGHGMAVISIILGYKVYGLHSIDGVAPGVKIIPVKVIGNQGWGFTSDLIAGIYYIVKLYESEVSSGGDVLPPVGEVNPVIISLSVGGPHSGLLYEVIMYAINIGVFIVAAAGNEGSNGMVYPAAYRDVISVGAVGWVKQFEVPGWWRLLDVPEELVNQIYIPNFSSRALEDQELDVLAPGAYVVTPYTPYGTAHPPLKAFRTSGNVPGQYYYLSGTSLAAPHVSGVLALMLQADMIDGSLYLNQTTAEKIIKNSTFKVSSGTALVYEPIINGWSYHIWGEDAIGSGLILADVAVSKV